MTRLFPLIGIGVLIMLSSQIAFAQEALENVKEIDPTLWKAIIEQVSGNLGLDRYAATYIMVMMGLRMLAEGGGMIADKTETKFDNKVIKMFAKALNAMSWFAGLFGIGTPKNVHKPKFKK